MKPNGKTSKARLRTALAKAKDITRRQKDLDTCIDAALQVALAAALAEDYAALLSEYPDVFPAPPVSPETVRAHAQQLREAQAAVEFEEADSRAARNPFNAILNDVGRAPMRPEKPS